MCPQSVAKKLRRLHQKPARPDAYPPLKCSCCATVCDTFSLLARHSGDNLSYCVAIVSFKRIQRVTLAQRPTTARACASAPNLRLPARRAAQQQQRQGAPRDPQTSPHRGERIGNRRWRLQPRVKGEQSSISFGATTAASQLWSVSMAWKIEAPLGWRRGSPSTCCCTGR